MTIISGKATKCHGIGTVKVHTDTGNSADIEALVVHKRFQPIAGLRHYQSFRWCSNHMERNSKVL